MKIAIETDALIDFVRERLGVGPDFDITSDGVTEVPFYITPKAAAARPEGMEAGVAIAEVYRKNYAKPHVHSERCRTKKYVGGKPRRGHRGPAKGSKLVHVCNVTGEEVR